MSTKTFCDRCGAGVEGSFSELYLVARDDSRKSLNLDLCMACADEARTFLARNLDLRRRREQTE